MRIVTLNANGIRAAARKGVFDWLPRQSADVICLQEIRAQVEQLTDRRYFPRRWHCLYESGQRKGYAGVALYSRREPDAVIRGFGVDEFDNEGRYLEARFGKLSVVSLYVPSGSASEARQASKFRFMDAFKPHLERLRESGRDYVICGDWNIAHRQIDLKNWRSNQKNSGFLPEEREWLTALFDGLGFVDAFREVNEQPDQYTWWSNRGQAWAKNVGWRIDYQILSPQLAGSAAKARIYKTRRFSDHAPLIMDYDF
jgi:exodeoxyribonuclease-3